MKNLTVFLIFIITICFGCFNLPIEDNKSASKDSPRIENPIESLKNWLESPSEKREPLEQLEFAKEALTKTQANIATNLLYIDKQALMTKEYGSQWDNRLLVFKDFKMPFYYQINGEEPSDGRNFFISLHGGGGAPAEVNDQQYQNQKHLYDAIIKKTEGVYLAPRAPTNTWNLWHQSHIDEFFNIIIQMAVIKENVNPNKVYLLGYSAGGDGVYQLAPRMADRWAAASMMAGHPNNASPVSLRNLPFAIHMGALDDAYDRNKVAKNWGDKLDELQTNDPGSYIHDVQIHEGLGHWMQLNDSIAIPWMTNHKRNAIPEKVEWEQSSRHHSSFYWVETIDSIIETKGKVRVEYFPALNKINIDENYGKNLQLLVNDKMLDLDKSITISHKNKVIHQGKFERSILNIYKTLSVKADLDLAFPCRISVQNNQTVSGN